MLKLNPSKGTLQSKSSVLLTIIYIPIIGIIFISMLLSTNTLKVKAYNSEMQFAKYYSQSVDYTLSNLGSYLDFYISYNKDLENFLLYSRNETDYRLNSYSLYQTLTSAAKAYDVIEYMFIYDSRNGECLIAANGVEDFQTTQALSDTLTDYYSGGIWSETGWKHLNSGKPWLMFAARYHTACIGIIANGEECLKASLAVDNSDRNMLMLNHEGECIGSLSDMFGPEIQNLSDQENGWVKIKGETYLFVCARLTSGDLYVCGIIPRATVYDNIPKLYHASALALLLVISCIPLIFKMTSRQLLEPIGSLADTMLSISEGNTDKRMEIDRKLPVELNVIYDSFNTMMDQVMNLQHDLLQRQKQADQLRLAQFRYQIRPHFFLNSLNTIYSLAETGQDCLIQKMVLSLSSYFRYIFCADRDFVKISDECQCVESFIGIKQTARREDISLSMEIGDGCTQALIPPFTIMTFVENSCKHALIRNRPLSVRVSVLRFEDGELNISVRDNGRGFDPSILEQLNVNRGLKTARGEHIGIYNACERLRISYEEQISVEFRNIDGGAAVDIRLPFITEVGDNSVPDTHCR